MAAAAPLPAGAPSSRRPGLQLVAAPRRRPSRRLLRSRRVSRRVVWSLPDGLYAATVATLLATGIVGVLLLNTAMQTQADRIALVKQRLAALQHQEQTLGVAVDQLSSPASLAARAAAMHLRPARALALIVLPARPPRRLPAAKAAPRARLSARERAAAAVHAG